MIRSPHGRTWTVDVPGVVDDVQAGAHVLVVGGALTGLSTASKAIAYELARNESFDVRRISARGLVGESSTQMEFVQKLFEFVDRSDDLADELDSAVWYQAVLDHLGSGGRRRAVLVIDTSEALLDVPWSVHVADWLRSLLGGGPAIRLVMLAKPRTIDGLGGASSPLIGLLKKTYVSPADEDLVRSDLVDSGMSVASAMRALRLLDGHPWGIVPAAELFESGAGEDEVKSRIRAAHADKIERQLSSISERALRVLRLLTMEGPMSSASVNMRLDGRPVDPACEELLASLLCVINSGVLYPTCGIHEDELSNEFTARLADRLELSDKDVDGYRLVSRLEWRVRHHLERRLRSCFGPEWVSILPAQIRSLAEERQEKERESEVVVASPMLLDYVDFGDLREILRVREVWREAFEASVDPWRESLMDALHRLEAMRRKIAHSRPLTSGEVDQIGTDVRTASSILDRTSP